MSDIPKCCPDCGAKAMEDEVIRGVWQMYWCGRAYYHKDGWGQRGQECMLREIGQLKAERDWLKTCWACRYWATGTIGVCASCPCNYDNWQPIIKEQK